MDGGVSLLCAEWTVEEIVFNSFGRNAAVARSVMKKYWTCWSKIKNKKRTRKQDLLLRIADITQFGCICYYFFLSFCFTSCFIQYVFLKTSVSHEGRWRGRHQPRRKMERKRAAATRRSEDCPSRPAPFNTVQTKKHKAIEALCGGHFQCRFSSVQTKKHMHKARQGVEVIVSARSALCKQRSIR